MDMNVLENVPNNVAFVVVFDNGERKAFHLMQRIRGIRNSISQRPTSIEVVGYFDLSELDYREKEWTYKELLPCMHHAFLQTEFRREYE